MFDNLCKLLVENFPDDFATWLLGEPIAFTELSPRELSLEPIRADSIILLQSKDVILHLEFQTEPDKNMPFRMADYCLRIHRRFPNKRLYQVVVYLHKTNSDLVKQTTFNIGEMSHRFHVIRMWEQPTDIFLQTPGLLPLAVLSNTPDQTNTLREVATLIGNVGEKQMQSNLAVTTFVLAGLVLEEEVIQQLLRRDIMRESVTYQLLVREGREEGLEEGLELGREEGLELGREEGRKEGLEVGVKLVAVNLFRQGMSLELISQVTGLTVVQLQQLQKSQVTKQDTPDQPNPSL